MVKIATFYSLWLSGTFESACSQRRGGVNTDSRSRWPCAGRGRANGRCEGSSVRASGFGSENGISAKRQKGGIRAVSGDKRVRLQRAMCVESQWPRSTGTCLRRPCRTCPQPSRISGSSRKPELKMFLMVLYTNKVLRRLLGPVRVSLLHPTVDGGASWC